MTQFHKSRFEPSTSNLRIKLMNKTDTGSSGYISSSSFGGESFEERFSGKFQPVQNLPPPEHFTRCWKTYASNYTDSATPTFPSYNSLKQSITKPTTPSRIGSLPQITTKSAYFLPVRPYINSSSEVKFLCQTFVKNSFGPFSRDFGEF